jgi:hypothetical protein
MLRKSLLTLSPLVLSLIAGCPQPPAAACGDGVDSDADAFIDAADPGCQSPEDDDENDPQCTDGVDNDFDGLEDGADPDCANNPNAEANLGALPDLRMTADVNDIDPGVTIFNRGNDGNFDAELADGCFLGDGDRTVLFFDGIIENIGADLVVGDTNDHQPTYTFNENLQQLEFAGWLTYTLLDTQRNIVSTGHKGSFCMLDLSVVDGFPGNAQFGDCGSNQGISEGMADIYTAGLPCQFVDITGLPSGDYTLQVEVNITKQLPESNYNNNIAEYPVSF